MKLHTSNSVTDESGLVYIARDLEQGETSFEETEDLVVQKLPLEEAIERDAKLHEGMPGKRYDIIFDMVTSGCPSFVKLIENEKILYQPWLERLERTSEFFNVGPMQTKGKRGGGGGGS